MQQRLAADIAALSGLSDELCVGLEELKQRGGGADGVRDGRGREDEVAVGQGEEGIEDRLGGESKEKPLKGVRTRMRCA